jgi:hypothetical protein
MRVLPKNMGVLTRIVVVAVSSTSKMSTTNMIFVTRVGESIASFAGDFVLV